MLSNWQLQFSACDQSSRLTDTEEATLAAMSSRQLQEERDVSKPLLTSSSFSLPEQNQDHLTREDMSGIALRCQVDPDTPKAMWLFCSPWQRHHRHYCLKLPKSAKASGIIAGYEKLRSQQAASYGYFALWPMAHGYKLSCIIAALLYDICYMLFESAIQTPPSKYIHVVPNQTNSVVEPEVAAGS